MFTSPAIVFKCVTVLFIIHGLNLRIEVLVGFFSSKITLNCLTAICKFNQTFFVLRVNLQTISLSVNLI